MNLTVLLPQCLQSLQNVQLLTPVAHPANQNLLVSNSQPVALVASGGQFSPFTLTRGAA
jgi:hypothetical protein